MYSHEELNMLYFTSIPLLSWQYLSINLKIHFFNAVITLNMRWMLGYPVPFYSALFYLQNGRVDFVVTKNLAAHIHVSLL